MSDKAECQIKQPEGRPARLLDALAWLTVKYSGPEHAQAVVRPANQQRLKDILILRVTPRAEQAAWRLDYVSNWPDLRQRSPRHTLEFYDHDEESDADLTSRIYVVPRSGSVSAGLSLMVPGEMTNERAVAASSFVCKRAKELRGKPFIKLAEEPLAALLADQTVTPLDVMPALGCPEVPFSGRTRDHVTSYILDL